MLEQSVASIPLHRQRVLVLDSSSFVGARLVAALASSDWAAPIAVNCRPGTRDPAGVPTMQFDLRSPGEMTEALRDIDAVANCIGDDPGLIATGAQALFAAASQQPGLRIVHLGSMVVYGAASGVVDEAAPLSAELGMYAAAKLSAEVAARSHPNTVSLRPSAEYGAGSRPWSDDLARLLLAGRLGELGANGAGQCNVVHVDDVVQAINAAIRRPELAGQVYNLSQPLTITWNEYLGRYAQALGMKTVATIGAGRFAFERSLLAVVLKLVGLLLQRLGLPAPPLVSPSMGRLFRQTIRLDSSKAEQDLGLKWTPLDEGLAEAAAAYRRPH